MASDFVRNIKNVRNIDILSPNITTENDLISTNDGEVYVVTNKGYRKITGVETKEIKQLKTDVSNLKKQSDTNTLNISDLTDDIETYTSDIKSLNTRTANNTSDIKTLRTSTGNNTSKISDLNQQLIDFTDDFEMLNTTTTNNTSEISDLKKSTSHNKTKIDSTNTLIEQLQKQLNDLKAKTKQYYTLYEGSEQGVGSTIELNDDFHNYYMIFISGHIPGGFFTEPILVKELSNFISIQKINLKDSDGTFYGCYEVKLTLKSNNVLEIADDVSWDEQESTPSGPERNAFRITNIEGVK